MKTRSSNGINSLTPREWGVSKVLWLVLVLSFSCAEFLDIDEPKNQVVGETAYENDGAATSAVIGIYSEMMNTPSFASISVTLRAGFSADELTSYAPDDFLANSILPSNAPLYTTLWEPGYKYIYYANSLLGGISKSVDVSDDVKQRLEGEAKFIRAFAYFYLTNLFGDVPLITGTDYRKNSQAGRTQQHLVYEQIINDLQVAEAFLPGDYTLYDNDNNKVIEQNRIRPNKWAATALLARVYLYTGAWAEAQTAATAVIDNTGLYGLADLAGVFLANSREAIWQLETKEEIKETFEKTTFTFINPGASILLRSEMVNAFEPGDERKRLWTGFVTAEGQQYYFPLKYRAGVDALPEEKEYSMVLRLAEQYLIRAEARAMQNDLSGAIADVDMIRQRAGLPLIRDINPLINQQGLLDAIMQERRIEFMAEWGHRWLDLKRTNRADPVLSSAKPDWQSTDVLYPIPQSEIDNNPSLNPQNEGY